MRNHLNPEAGATPMPSDPREIAAALEGGVFSLALTPYYGFRYGERGQRFTRSDSAFLATLADHTPIIVERQIKWLAGVLSNRGMPSILLEHHLRVLTRALRRNVPEREDGYVRLWEAANLLRDTRRAQISDEDFTSLAHTFAREAGLEPTRLAIGTGRLLVSAVADERSGIPNAVSSIEAWFTNTEVFSLGFIRAVRKTLQRARAAERPSEGEIRVAR